MGLEHVFIRLERSLTPQEKEKGVKARLLTDFAEDQNRIVHYALILFLTRKTRLFCNYDKTTKEKKKKKLRIHYAICLFLVSHAAFKALTIR